MEDSTWNNLDSIEQIALQQYSTGAFKEIEKRGDYRFQSTVV